MKEIRTTAVFDAWFEKLSDDHAIVRIQKRIDRAEEGNYGDHKRFSGIVEMRIDYGPGYRLYCVERGKIVLIVLAGGTKSGQRKDIERAIQLAKEL